MVTEWVLLGVLVVLTFATGIFVAAEFSMIAVDKSDVERRANEGNTADQRVLKGLKTLSTQLSGAQVGITITTLLVGYLVEPSLGRLLHPVLESVGVPDALVTSVAVLVAITLATIFSMLFGELVPKNAAISEPVTTSRWSVPLQRAFTWLTMPLIKVLNGSANKFLRSVGVEPQEELSDGRNSQELLALVRRSAEQGTLDVNTAELLTKSLEFTQLTADDVMTPRVQMTTLPRTATASDVAMMSRSTGISRFPIIEADSDDVIGLVHLKHVVAVPYEERDSTSVSTLMVDPLRVPETIRLSPLLAQLRSGGWQVALVMDEYGGTAGLVTLEDVVEEIVGEVDDEHDQSAVQVRKLSNGAYSIPASLRPDEVQDVIDLGIEDAPEYETMAGYMQMRLESIGHPGDSVEVRGGRLDIVRMEGRRIDRLRFYGNAQAGE